MRVRLIARAFLAALCGLAVAPTSPAQDQPAKLINQHIKAQGGSGRLSKIRSLVLEGVVTRTSDGKTGTFTLDTKFPNRYYLELLLGEQVEILAYNGKSAWQLASDGRATTLLEQDALQLEAEATLANSHLLDLHKNKIAIAPAGDSAEAARQVVLSMPSGVKRQLAFDPKSHLLQKESGALLDAPWETSYRDYRDEAGIQVPHQPSACSRRPEL